MTRKLEVRRVGSGQGYAVFDGAERVSTTWWNWEIAEHRMERMLRKERLVTRDCITCRRPFRSEGAHNRMCNPCRQAHREGSVPCAFGAPRRGATSRSES
jgi:hypothetical protein